MKYRYTNIPSMLQGDVPESEAVSYLSGRSGNIDFHHIMNGSKYSRKLSEQYGMWIWLTRDEHEKLHSTPEGAEYARTLKQECQQLFELEHPRSMWLRLFHKNYL